MCGPERGHRFENPDFFPVTMPLGLRITSISHNAKGINLRPLTNVRSGSNVSSIPSWDSSYLPPVGDLGQAAQLLLASLSDTYLTEWF